MPKSSLLASYISSDDDTPVHKLSSSAHVAADAPTSVPTAGAPAPAAAADDHQSWYRLVIKKEEEVEKLQAQLGSLNAELAKAKEAGRGARMERSHWAKEMERAQEELCGLDVEEVGKQRQAAQVRRDAAAGRKAAMLRKIQSARDSLGEVKLLHREYGTAISALASEKRTCSKEVRRMHEQLTSLDSYAGELHELIVKENAKRKALKTEISVSITAHDEEMLSMKRRIEKFEKVEFHKRELQETSAQFETHQEEWRKLTYDGAHLNTIASNRALETEGLRRQLKTLWSEHQILLRQIEQDKQRLWELESKRIEVKLLEKRRAEGGAEFKFDSGEDHAAARKVSGSVWSPVVVADAEGESYPESMEVEGEELGVGDGRGRTREELGSRPGASRAADEGKRARSAGANKENCWAGPTATAQRASKRAASRERLSLQYGGARAAAGKSLSGRGGGGSATTSTSKRPADRDSSGNNIAFGKTLPGTSAARRAAGPPRPQKFLSWNGQKLEEVLADEIFGRPVEEGAVSSAVPVSAGMPAGVDPNTVPFPFVVRPTPVFAAGANALAQEQRTHSAGQQEQEQHIPDVSIDWPAISEAGGAASQLDLVPGLNC